jgi:hypothetical protein
MMTRTMFRHAAMLAVALALAAGCASLPPRTLPRVDVIAVQLDRLDGPDAHFAVSVQLTNDGADEIVVDQLQAIMAIEGEPVAQASLAVSPVRVPPHGTARAELAARTGMDAVLRAVASAMRRGATAGPGARPALRYAISGSATLGGGFRMPFSRSGEIGERSR